jgi:hypothetical protein
VVGPGCSHPRYGPRWLGVGSDSTLSTSGVTPIRASADYRGSKDLPTDVEEVVMRLVPGVHSHPSQGPFDAPRVVVLDGPLPICVTQMIEHAGEHGRCIGELPGDVDRILFCVRVMRGALVTTHRFE